MNIFNWFYYGRRIKHLEWCSEHLVQLIKGQNKLIDELRDRVMELEKRQQFTKEA